MHLSSWGRRNLCVGYGDQVVLSSYETATLALLARGDKGETAKQLRGDKGELGGQAAP